MFIFQNTLRSFFCLLHLNIECSNAVGIILAILGLLNPLIAAGAMLASSLSVVANSMRLREPKGKTLEKVIEILIPWREPTK